MQNYPYDDNYMVYDYRLHMYVLTERSVAESLGVNLTELIPDLGTNNNTTMVKRRLVECSQAVYRYIYEDSWNSEFLEWILAKLPILRDKIYTMLLAQLSYILDNGQINAYSGINLAKGTAIDIKLLRGVAKVADTVQEIASKEDIGMGYNYPLKTACKLPCVPCELYRKGY